MPTNIVAFPRRKKPGLRVSTELLTMIVVALGVLVVIGLPASAPTDGAWPTFALAGP